MGTQTCIHQNIVQHSKFEKNDLPTTELGTTCQTGIRYIMPFFRNIVHHLQMRGASNICYLLFNSPQPPHILFFMLPWTPNACSDVSKCDRSMATLLKLDFQMHPNYMFPQSNSPWASHLLFFMLPWTPNACCDVSK